MPNKNFFRKVPVAVPHRSGFDKSYRNLFTAKCGTLTPILCDEVIPNTTVHLDLALSAQLPPLASETFMNVDYKVEAFFVPTRLLMAGYEDWLSGNDVVSNAAGTTTRVLRAPVVLLGPTTCAPGTLSDYLGVMYDGSTVNGEQSTDHSRVTAFPYLAYGLIWDTWYRNSLVQRSLFYNQQESTVNNFHGGYNPANMKWFTPTEDSNNYILGASSFYADSSNIFALRQRNFGMDYFTMATPSAQNGATQKVTMTLPLGDVFISGTFNDEMTSSDFAAEGSVGIDGATIVNDDATTSPITTSFTISSLRAANSMQQFLERNNLIGNRLVDYVKGQYGANLKDSIAQRPVYLGSASFPVYSKGIYQSNPSTSADVSSNNPFASVGARYGHAYSEGNANLIDFTAEEPGYIMVLGSLVPEVTYSSGVERYLSRYIDYKSQSDMANPILQNVGNQPIYLKEILANTLFLSSPDERKVFGYVERYADWKTRNHQLHGLLRDGSTLESFALQRSFQPSGTNDFGISSHFLTIPTDFLDQVTAVDETLSNYGIWVDTWLNYKVSMPLYEYSLPSLQDPAWEHGNVFNIDRGGVHID